MMGKFRSLPALYLAFVSSCAALNTELVISNAKVAPDGFPMEYVIHTELMEISCA
jgi:iron transport multicopper oxidase